MKIIEGMKAIKALQEKAKDLRDKVGNHCADLDFETPVYDDQRAVVRGWLQAHEDISKEILSLHTRIQRTNLETNVTITIGGHDITKTIAEWVYRRRVLAALDQAAWAKLGDKGLKEGAMQTSGGTVREVKIRRYFHPEERDLKVDTYRSEPHLIDATLEVVNATTDLL